MLTLLTRFTNIIIAALLAGTSFGIWIGFNPMNYSASTYVEQQKNLVLSLNTLMVTLVIVATVVTVLSAYLQRKNKTIFFTLIIAAVSFASCIIISRFGNLPIQKEMLAWDADSLPTNWTDLRDKWWSFHIIRTIAELVALVLVSWSTVQKPNDHL
ncbi:MAG: DUF1772 domain-containing protein [Cyclobacteriaceae bacterium]|nr:DUF1772 domain-containing protein [Cyclobacteriaceae bacterium]UYN87842.1 MAG: DUF1772 domain-containing protein [Cyclobacteriaceae bacterium]